MKRRDTGGGVRLALAQYRELVRSRSSRATSTRRPASSSSGRLVTELMKQPQYQPLQVWEMALTLFAVNNGYFDDIEVKKALAAERLDARSTPREVRAARENMEESTSPRRTKKALRRRLRLE